MNILAEIANLDFPQGQYVVVGSAILSVLGLKDCRDLDIVVSPALFEQCAKNGWEQLLWTYQSHAPGTYLRKGTVELYLDVNCGDFNPTFADLLSRSVLIKGINFACPEDILNFKKEYVKYKPKHAADIKLLEDVIANDLFKRRLYRIFTQLRA